MTRTRQLNAKNSVNIAPNLFEKKEGTPLQKGHVKDIGSTVGEIILSLSPMVGGKIPN